MKMFYFWILSTPSLRRTWFVHSMLKYVPVPLVCDCTLCKLVHFLTTLHKVSVLIYQRIDCYYQGSFFFHFNTTSKTILASTSWPFIDLFLIKSPEIYWFRRWLKVLWVPMRVLYIQCPWELLGLLTLNSQSIVDRTDHSPKWNRSESIAILNPIWLQPIWSWKNK